MRVRNFLLVLSATLSTYVCGQPAKGLGVELSASFNTLSLYQHAIPHIQPARDYPFQDFYITYGARVFYRYPIWNQIVVHPFVQYGQIGGKRTSDNPAEYVLKHWSLGTFLSYVLDPVDIGIAYRANRLINPILRAFAPDTVGLASGRWVEYDAKPLFSTWVHSWGLRAAYRIDNWSVAVEGWFTLGRIESDLINSQVDYTQNQYAISIGYLILP
jgi:hypothetical protein